MVDTMLGKHLHASRIRCNATRVLGSHAATASIHMCGASQVRTEFLTFPAARLTSLLCVGFIRHPRRPSIVNDSKQLHEYQQRFRWFWQQYKEAEKALGGAEKRKLDHF